MNEDLQPIYDLFDGYKDAVYNRDANAFAALFVPGIFVFDMWMKWSHDGIGEWKEMATGWFESLGEERVVVTSEVQRAEISGDMGYACAFVTFTAMSKDGVRLRSLQNRMTWVVRKTGDGWKVAHEHTSGPVDFETGKAMLQS